MQLANRLQKYLDQRKVRYELRLHEPTDTLEEAASASNLDPHNLARAVLLEDDRGLLLAVLPAHHLLDFQALKQALGRDLRPAPHPVVAATFHDCEPRSVPAIGEPWGLPTVVDNPLFGEGDICFEPGHHRALVCLSRQDFERLHEDSRRLDLSRPLSVLESRDPRDFVLPGNLERNHPILALRPASDIRHEIEAIERLPAMPEMARRLLRVRNDPHATIHDLADIVAVDPSLTAQVIRYARSAFFNYQGRIDTLDQAIGRVLGFDNALSMCLGLAASRTFRNPADGPLGLQAFWRHATYSAALAQALATALRARLAINPGMAYLAGLLHNFGFLLAGHLFRSEFFLLNRVVAANPQIPVPLIEKRVMGVEHTEMGGWLMSAWEMPEPVITSVTEHHNETYAGEHAMYANLVLLVDHLLRAEGIGDGADSEPPPLVLNALGLDLETAREICTRVLESAEALDAMARQLAA